MSTKILYLAPARFDLIYMLSLKLPSWKIIGSNILENKVTPEEYEFVLNNTGRKLKRVNNDN